jgi:hypothetical protein
MLLLDVTMIVEALISPDIVIEPPVDSSVNVLSVALEVTFPSSLMDVAVMVQVEKAQERIAVELI